MAREHTGVGRADQGDVNLLSSNLIREDQTIVSLYAKWNDAGSRNTKPRGSDDVPNFPRLTQHQLPYTLHSNFILREGASKKILHSQFFHQTNPA